MSERVLYGYWRSSAAYRVRIALNLKQLSYQQRSVHLVKGGGEQYSDAYHQINPNHLVPVLVDGEVTLNQSLAIIEYLDEVYPQVRLVPNDLQSRYLVKSMAQDIAIDIHPLNNLRVLQYLSQHLDAEDKKMDWYRHWITTGFAALEQRLSKTRGDYCVGNQVTMVDVCLVPQVYNANRFDVDMDSFPKIQSVTASLSALEAFRLAQPELQPDADGA